MLLLDEETLMAKGIDWNETIRVIQDAVKCLSENDFSQPVKPYLRYRDLRNRIIAMPAFVGGNINMAGIKWIASFPGNIDKGIPRAHSVVILNDADTGEPLGIICTPLLSIVRTASVSGLVIRYFEKVRKLNRITIGITGFGPIGQYHLKMCQSLFSHRIERVLLYDPRPIDRLVIDDPQCIVTIVNSWEAAYLDSDIFITCTVANAPYIDRQPKAGSLHLNVSLRDYTPAVYEWFKGCILVDNWEEVCRERTDIESMHLEKGLQKKDTRSIIDIVEKNAMYEYDHDAPIMFNPMGMAVFDIAMGNYYYQNEKMKSNEREIG